MSARALAEAARGRLVQAGLYLNPIVTARIDELGDRNGPAGTPDVNLLQDIVIAGWPTTSSALTSASGVASAPRVTPSRR